MNDVILNVDQVSRSFGGRSAVKNASFNVQRGEIVGFLGPNGAGKTTIISMIAGLLKPDDGQITMFGGAVGTKSKKLHARMGYLQEKPRIYPEMTARGYLALFCDLYGIRNAKNRVDEVLNLVNLSDVPHYSLNKFSRGMQQRVCLARVLLHSPDFLMLDEPTLGLDPRGLAQMRGVFKKLNDMGVTLFFSSHQLAEMERICDRVILMQSGKIIAAGRQDDLAPDELVQRAFEVEVAEQDTLDENELTKLASIDAVKTGSNGQLWVYPRDHQVVGLHQSRIAISRDLAAAGYTVLNVGSKPMSLEDLFLYLTEDSKQPEEG